jgi:hypothetical protein
VSCSRGRGLVDSREIGGHHIAFVAATALLPLGMYFRTRFASRVSARSIDALEGRRRSFSRVRPGQAEMGGKVV